MNKNKEMQLNYYNNIRRIQLIATLSGGNEHLQIEWIEEENDIFSNIIS